MKEKVKKFWSQHGDIIVAAGYSAALIAASAITAQTLTKARCDAGWAVKSGKFGNEEETIVVLEHKNGLTTHLILHKSK